MNKVTRLTLAVAVSICASIPMLAQSTNSGDIRGTVTDKSGAVVPGATVSIEDIDKNVTKTFTTNGDGVYDTGSVVPDHYILTFSKTGFSTVVRGPVTVEVGELGVNAELAVGATSQRVVVNTNVPLLKTETGDQSTTFTANSLEQLPQVSGNNGAPSLDPSWESFIQLLPGAEGTPMNANNSASPGIQAAINGNLPYSDVLSDGATATLPMSQNTAVGGYILDTVGELKIETSSFSAQYGVGGIIYNQIGKGGTDQFHGAGYEYFQNDALNAVPYFNTKKTFLRFDNYGFNVGGPILRKRAFFFFDFDKTYLNGGASTNQNVVPTAAERTGDFTGDLNPNVAGGGIIYDPSHSILVTSPADGKQYTQRPSFISEYGTNAIPAGQQDTVSLAFEKYYPAENTPNSNGTPNLKFNVPGVKKLTKYYGRLDVDITAKNRLTATDFESDEPYTTPNSPNPCPVNCQAADIEDQNAEVSDVWTVSPKLINEARFGFVDELNFFVPDSLGKGLSAGIGLLSAKADRLPSVNIANSAGNFLQLENSGNDINAVYKEFAFDPSDVVTLIVGRNVLHFGGELLMNEANNTAWGNVTAGNFDFNGTYTQSYDAAATVATETTTNPHTVIDPGNAYADFLLGQVQNWNANNTPQEGGRLKLPQFFAQDDIQLRPNLTVNVGLRWQGMTGWTEVKGNELTFDPTLNNTANNTPGAMWNGVTKPGGRSRIMAPVWDTFLPRLGFSYQPTNNTVVRGGVGLYAYTWSTDTYAQGLAGLFGSKGSISDNTGGFAPVDIFGDDGNTNYQVLNGTAVGTSINASYIPASTDPAAYNGSNVSYQQYHTPVPKIWQYNLQVQRELGNNLVAELGYVGSHGFNLVYPTDLNEVPVSKLAPGDSASRPYPNFGNISGAINTGISNYNSLQAELQKRLSGGLSFDVNYVWSHFLDDQDSSGWGSRGGNQFWQLNTPSSNYANSNFDVRNALKGQVVYQLPIGKGRRFLNNNWLVDEVIGGWQLSSTLVVQSGNPYTLTIGGTDNSYTLAGNNYKWFPNVVGHASNPKTIAQWYNPANYAVPATGTLGNSRRNSQEGPGYNDLSLSAAKTFPVWKSVAAYIAASADNVLNHPSFGQPNSNIDAGTQAGQITSVTNGGRSMMLTGKILF